MNDVARVAGVSRGSISNYINGRRTKPATQLKIEAAIEQLNYVPNATARALKTNKSNYVVLIIPTVNTPFFSELSYHMQLSLNQFGYKMILCNSNSNPEDEIDYIQMANMQKVAGIITMSYSDIADIVSPNIPLVAIEKPVSPQFPLVVSDNYAGGQLAAKQLQTLGAKKLLFISKAPVKNISSIREKGFKDFCTKNNLSVSTFLASDSPYFINDFEAFIINHTHNHDFAYDGIFSDADEYASDFWHLLMQQHIDVPNTVQIIGFDAAHVYKRQKIFLSSIRQPVEAIAKTTVEKLYEQMASQHPVSQATITTLPVTFQQGFTTKKVRP